MAEAAAPRAEVEQTSLWRGGSQRGGNPGPEWASFGPAAKAQEVKAVQRREGLDCPGRPVLAEEYSENVP